VCPPCFGTRGPPRPSGSRAAGRRRPFRFRAPSTSGTGSPLQRQASLTGKPSAARRSGDAFFLQRDRNGGVRIGYHEQSSVPKGSYPEKVFGSMIEYGMTAQRPRNGPLCESECVDFLGNTPPVPGIRARGRGRSFAPQSVCGANCGSTRVRPAVGKRRGDRIGVVRNATREVKFSDRCMANGSEGVSTSTRLPIKNESAGLEDDQIPL